MRGGQQYRIDAQVAAEIDRYMKRPCSPARPDGLTPLQSISPGTKAEAARQWNEIPDTLAEIAAWMKGEPL